MAASAASLESEWDRLVAITVVSASDLKNADWIGTSDPYFKLDDFNGKVIGGNDGGDKCKSKHVDNNLNPVWNETHIFLVDKQTDRFKIRVKDKASIGAMSKDIGEALVMLDKVHERERKVALSPQGIVTLKFKITTLNNVAP